MNFVRAIVVAAAPPAPAPGAPDILLYANPSPTPDGMRELELVMRRNPNFAEAELISVIDMPRHLGGEPDRLFGGIWWIESMRSLVIAYRGMSITEISSAAAKFGLRRITNSSSRMPS